jgi:hypothetical protein
MSFLTKRQYTNKIKNSDYWQKAPADRWAYMSRAIKILKTLDARRIIEAGSEGIPLYKHSTILPDYPAFDLNKTPYPYNDKEFDVFVALQVWEHLTERREAFNEARRISKAVILSVPFNWTERQTRHENHRGITMKEIGSWAGRAPDETKTVSAGGKKRIVCLWTFKEDQP